MDQYHLRSTHQVPALLEKIALGLLVLVVSYLGFTHDDTWFITVFGIPIAILAFDLLYRLFTDNHLILDSSTLIIRKGRELIEIDIQDIDELFYVVEVNEQPTRKYELPDEYQIIKGNLRYQIDLTKFRMDDIIDLNSTLQQRLGDLFTIEENYTRKVAKSSKSQRMNQDREFIHLTTLDDY